MEKLSPAGDYLRLNSDISLKNGKRLQELKDSFNTSLSEHIRRATAVYAFSMQLYESGGYIHSVSASKKEVIPLFDVASEDSDTDTPVPLSVIVNVETAKALNDFGVISDGESTTVLDNVINLYSHIMTSSMNGDRVIITNPDGSKAEMLIAGNS